MMQPTAFPLTWPATMPPPGGRFIDIAGSRFGSCVAIGVTEKRGTKYYYRCVCDCGVEFTARAEHLKQGRVASCGCLKAKRAAALGSSNRTHGQSSSGGSRDPSATYKTWKSMKERCLAPRHKSFARYGGRGIRVCDRWLHGEAGLTGFECFLSDMGERPSTRHSIDRYPDNDGNYEPGNCRWATSKEQHWTQKAHPDAGGSDAAMSELNAAKAEALKEIGG
jgi:hypothetical protein